MNQPNINPPLADNTSPNPKTRSKKRLWLKVLSHKPMPLLLSISTLWIVGSIWAYQMSCCFAPVSSLPLSIQDGTVSVASALDNIQFTTASALPEMSNDVNAEILKTAQYIKTHPDKLLIIKGQEWAEKENKGLGIQRAANVKAELTKLGAPFKRIITTSEVVVTMEGASGKIFDGVRFEIKTLPNQSLMIESQDGLVAKAKTNLSFNKNSANILHPYPNEVQRAASRVVAYLKKNPTQALIIKGWSGISENHEYLESIGNQRAVSLRNWWIGMGSPISQVIVLRTESDMELFWVDNQLLGGADYFIAPVADYVSVPKTKEKVEVTEAELAKVAQSVTIYFDTDSHIPKIDTIDAKTLEVYINYLKSNPRAKVVLSGYTDDVGLASYNLKLSGKRAVSIQDYLEKRAVSANQIEVKKMGILKSKAKISSNIEQARKQNRKVELSIIK